VLLPIIALIAAALRWVLQGSSTVYTTLSKRFYIPDPDLGVKVSAQHPIWLGLTTLAVIAAIAAGLAVAGWILRRLEARRQHPIRGLRAAAWIVAALPLIVPIAAFASGGRPAGGLDTPPVSKPATAATEPGGGKAATIDAPAGRYEIVEHEGTSITAHMSAGGETFDAQFGKGIRGSWQGDPHDLSKPTTAEIGADAAKVDTGIELRSKHAREEYLFVDKFPRITLAIDRLIAATQAGPNNVGFRAHATLGLIGKTHSVEIAGTLRKPDASALARLGLSGEVLLVKADFNVSIKETAMAADAKDFDGDTIPIQVSLVLRRTGN
jgi:polyisoprenoid-binding protein YceI